MKKEFLQDYEAKEIQEYERYRAQVNAGDSSPVFPAISRFTGAQAPLVIADHSSFASDGVKIWTQVPFAKTLVIPLLNVRKENLLEMNSFDVSDIPHLIEMSKETGRVQFALTMTPSHYVNLDHLRPIFDELKPPMLQPIPMEPFVDSATWKKWHDEFDNLGNKGYFRFMIDRIVRQGGEGQQYYSALMNSHAFAYVKLKLLKMDDIIAALSTSMVNDPDMASRILYACNIVYGPFFEALHANRNLGFTAAQLFGPIQTRQSNAGNNTRFPVEVGAFLMKKMTLYPSTYHACNDVIYRYEQNDLYKVLESVDKAIRDRKKDETISNVQELGTIMDNVWKDASRIKIADEIAKEGIGLGVGAIGSFATSLIGAGTGVVEGLLAGLGFNVADRVLGKFDSSITNKLLRLLNKDYIMNIYDFQKKLPKR